MRTAPLKENYTSYEESLQKSLIPGTQHAQTDALLRELLYKKHFISTERADSLQTELLLRMPGTSFLFWSEPDIEASHTSEQRFSVNGMLIDDRGNIVLQSAIKGPGEVRTGIDLFKKFSRIDVAIARQIEPDARYGDTLTLPKLYWERTTLRGVTAVADSLENNMQMLAGQNLLSSIELTLNHQFFEYEAKPVTSFEPVIPNILLVNTPYLRTHDGNGNLLIYALDLNSETLRIFNDRARKFLTKDVQIEITNDEPLSKADIKSYIQVDGVLGSHVFRNRKVRINLSKGVMEVYREKYTLPDGIYAIAGTARREDHLGFSNIEVIKRAKEFIRPGEQHQPKEIGVYTHDFVPLSLSAPPDEIAEEGETVSIRLYFSEQLTDKLERFTEELNGGHIVLVIAGNAVTMQPIFGKVENLKSVDVTRCTPAAARYLHLHLQDNTIIDETN